MKNKKRKNTHFSFFFFLFAKQIKGKAYLSIFNFALTKSKKQNSKPFFLFCFSVLKTKIGKKVSAKVLAVTLLFILKQEKQKIEKHPFSFFVFVISKIGKKEKPIYILFILLLMKRKNEKKRKMKKQKIEKQKQTRTLTC